MISPSLIDRVALLSYLARQDRQSLLSQIKILNWLDTFNFYLNFQYVLRFMVEIGCQNAMFAYGNIIA